MVFCYQNCSDLLWEKTCSSNQEKLLKFEAESQKFAKILRSLKQFLKQKAFKIVPGVFPGGFPGGFLDKIH